ncbi:hypothetical protein [Enterovirga aerilata]|uniref:Uncharacterized protein n=1 Tax=Enterovirga aerilata TaxID=2730920 RepID=A0A849IBA8_9HYPH|nr:hypothetical protein [Enterovirga sp. DB1703]NNM73545.1 hypothetical protein [Enterovirga sp. DB1703]
MDPELDRLIREEMLAKSLQVSLRLATLAEQLATSLERAAASFERLANAPAEAAARREAFRRAECPGRFE